VSPPVTICTRCNRAVPRRGVAWPEGFVCNRCYQQATRRHGPCPDCGRHRLLPGLHGNTPCCADCSGIDKDFACTRCGQEDEPHRKGLCARCCLREDLTAMLADSTGAIPTTVRPLAEALIAQEHPRSALIWLRNPEVVALLQGFADGSLPMTHGSFAAQANRRTANHLRDLFVHHGLLPPRDRTLLGFQAWLERTLAAYPPATACLLAGFANWHHLRQMRALAQQGQLTPGRAATARQEITTAAQLLAHLQDNGIAPSDLRQAHIDAWLAQGPTTRYTARTFVVWAVRTRRLPKVDFPHRAGRTRPVLPEDQRLQLLRRGLTDPAWAPAWIRLAAVLLLLYGQPTTRISRLRLSDITDAGEHTAIDLGNQPAVLPPAVADLLAEHLADRPNTSTATNRNSPWLFPGARAGQPISADHLMNQLRKHGVELQAARNGALRQLLLDMPPAIASKVLGYSANVTEKHARHAAQNWNSYPATRKLDNEPDRALERSGGS